MSQTTLSDEDLFGEAAAEMREDVESHLEQARAELPSAAAVWETEADNVLGVLNGLRSALDVGDAEEQLRQAKKWYTMGERADAFEDADDLSEAIEELEAVVASIREAEENVGDLTNAIPELRGTLQDLEADEDE
ncbi:DUF5790 family protein [Haloplanus sp. GCM10025708]|uniref:DUF5790 family protein n=1 Tax=Haloferacaceae TaxID=1644056 RepID=UPI00360D0793